MYHRLHKQTKFTRPVIQSKHISDWERLCIIGQSLIIESSYHNASDICLNKPLIKFYFHSFLPVPGTLSSVFLIKYFVAYDSKINYTVNDMYLCKMCN